MCILPFATIRLILHFFYLSCPYTRTKDCPHTHVCSVYVRLKAEEKARQAKKNKTVASTVELFFNET